jgi:hypothetical protein
MNVGSNIENGPGGMAKTSPSQMLVTMTGAGSFRSSWQSLLTSMGTIQSGFSENEPGAKSAADAAEKHAKVHEEAEPVTEKPETQNSKGTKSEKPGSASSVAQELSLAGMVAMASPLPAFVEPVTLAGAAMKQDVPAIAADDLADRTGQSVLPLSMLMQTQGRETTTGDAVARSAVSNRSEHIAEPGSSSSVSAFEEPSASTHSLATDSFSEKTGHTGAAQKLDDTAPQEKVTDGIDQSTLPASRLVFNQSSSPALERETVTAGEEASNSVPTQTQIVAAHSGLQTPAPIQSQLPGRELHATAAPEPSFGMNPLPASSPVEVTGPVQPLATGPMLGKRVGVTGIRSSGHAGSSASQVSSSIHLVPQGNPQIGGQPANTSFDESRFVRIPGSSSSPGNIAGAAGEASAGAISQGSHEAFAALDAESAAGAPAWVHAGAHRAEAGFQDPALGWVGVRVEGNGAGVHAALLPGSLEAAETLGGHLPGLNSYLAEHHVRVETLTVTAPDNDSSGTGMDNATGQNMGHEAGHGAAQETETGNRAGGLAQANAGQPAESEVLDRTIEAAAAPGASGNMHISVMA